MSRANQQNLKIQLGVLFLLVAQVFSVAHASESGSIPHEHNGVVCLAILTGEPDELAPPAQLVAPSLNDLAPAANITPSQPVVFGQQPTFRPPATGPPST